MKPFGYQLSLDCYNCSNINDTKFIKSFINEMLSVSKTIKWGPTLIKNRKTGPIKLRGISAVQLLHTSSLTCHFVNATKNAYIDFFSCKKFNKIKLIKCVRDYFAPYKITTRYLTR